MSTINKFEDIVAWQKARKLSNEIYNITTNKPFTSDLSLKDQIQRSTGSIMDNIAEGFERGGNKEFIQFLCIAKGSNSEVRSQLYRALDQKYITNERFKILYDLSIEIGQLLGSFINYLKKSNIKGIKYKEVSE